jgi:hypothetical protein
MAQNEAIKVRSISDFKSQLTGGGARPNLFEVNVTLPDGITSNLQGLGGDTEWDGTEFRFMCKAASLPASNVASIEIPFRGRLLKVAGDRTIDPWTVTIINDENFRFRKVFENWAQNIAQYGDASGLNDPNTYMGSGDVYQLGRAKSGKQGFDSGAPGDGNTLTPLAQYRFEDIFPTAVSAIDLSYDTENTIEEFTVDFAVNYYYPVK